MAKAGDPHDVLCSEHHHDQRQVEQVGERDHRQRRQQNNAVDPAATREKNTRPGDAPGVAAIWRQAAGTRR
jgi:hypothetical protein